MKKNNQKRDLVAEASSKAKNMHVNQIQGNNKQLSLKLNTSL
jgi:hypothetical protein